MGDYDRGHLRTRILCVNCNICVNTLRRYQVLALDPRVSTPKMTLRWGIVSAGKISHDFVNAFNSYPDVGDQKIVAVAARDKTRAAEFAKTHNIPKVFDSYEALAKSQDIDVAYIGALNPAHYALTKLFLENGKNVLCEKPFCLNLKQAQSLIKLAQKKNLFLMEAVWSRFAPAYLDLEKEINAGKFGEIKLIEGNFGIVSHTDRVISKESGDSAILDVGVYLLQLAQFIFKEEPKKVIAVGTLSETGVDVGESIILEYSNGRRAVLNSNLKLRMYNKATLYGTKSIITLEEPFHFPDKVTNEDGSVKTFPLHTSKLPYNYVNSPGLVYEALEVARCIKAGLKESPRMSHNDTLVFAKLQGIIMSQVGVHYDVDDKEFP